MAARSCERYWKVFGVSYTGTKDEKQRKQAFLEGACAGIAQSFDLKGQTLDEVYAATLATLPDRTLEKPKADADEMSAEQKELCEATRASFAASVLAYCEPRIPVEFMTFWKAGGLQEDVIFDNIRWLIQYRNLVLAKGNRDVALKCALPLYSDEYAKTQEEPPDINIQVFDKNGKFGVRETDGLSLPVRKTVELFLGRALQDDEIAPSCW